MDHRRWTKIGFSPLLPEPVPGLRRFSPSSRIQAAVDGMFCCEYFSSSSIQTVCMGLSTGVYFSGTTSYVGKIGQNFLLVVVQDPISRAHHLSAPAKSHCVASNNKMYSNLSPIQLRRRTCQALTPSDEQASAATVATTFTVVHTRTAVHDPPYRALMQHI